MIAPLTKNAHVRQRRTMFGSCVVWIVVVLLMRTTAVGDCSQNIATFADGLSPTALIHVSTVGSDATGDGSAKHPYGSIGFAATFATPGSAIVIHPGTYPGGTSLYDLAGTAEQPIWIGGARSDDRPIIDGGSEGLHLVRGKYLIIHDLIVRNSAFNGVNCDDGGEFDNPLASHHLLFQNLSIHDIGGTGNQDGLKLSGIRDFVVLDSVIERTGGGFSGSGIDHVGCHHGLIARCTFIDMSGNAIQIKGGSSDIDVRWCCIIHGGQRGIMIGGSTLFSVFRPPLSKDEPNSEARNIRVAGNVFVGSVAAVAFVGCVDSVVANNTIIDPTNWLFRILQETTSTEEYEFLPCSNNRFENNLVYFDRSELSTYVNIGPNTDPGSFSFTSNLWYAHDNPAESQPNLPAGENGGIAGLDPLLIDPAASDYTPGSAGPAARAAVAMMLLQTDEAGRRYHCPASIGALEALTHSADLNCDGRINVEDLLLVIANWGSGHVNGDANGDGIVNVADLLMVIADWGKICWQS